MILSFRDGVEVLLGLAQEVELIPPGKWKVLGSGSGPIQIFPFYLFFYKKKITVFEGTEIEFHFIRLPHTGRVINNLLKNQMNVNI